MGKAQPFVHLKPANLVLKSFNKQNASSSAPLTAPLNAKGTSSPMLRVNLNKFPSFIGHCTSRVNRRVNEDTYSINMLKLPASGQEMQCLRNKNIKDKKSYWDNELPLKKSVLNLSVFDGHGSDRISKLLAKELHHEIAGTLPSREAFFDLLRKYKDVVGGKYWSKLYTKREAYFHRFIANCNTKQEQVLFENDKSGSRMIFDTWGNIIDKNSLLTENERLRLFTAYLNFDFKHCCDASNVPEAEKVDNRPVGGSTASSVFITPYHEDDSYDETFLANPESLLKLIVTQVGDTKIVLCDKNGIAHSLTKIHHPTSSRESRRLGTSFQTDSFGDTRFLDNFANTRSFGDSIGKQDGLSCEPDIYSYLIGSTRSLPHSEISKLQFGGDECFVCLITDGVSDLMSDQELVDLITSTVNLRGFKTASPQFVSEEVVRFVAAIGGQQADNATCLVLRLPNWGNWPCIDRTGAIREEKLLSASSGSERSNV
ncbi:LANO_0A01222g1_1 [Lachancea nothofagi CBS 11611]|uniref:LANO_0A01222g1_1 n=1 Tax=Lachancea nothofagi CBS 11611 TaxID=1266666 RepID=A0A1G4IME8_9SACH|nr:LANO_0A01222g1_1 [Lachancea nothofagi CBS 11611]